MCDAAVCLSLLLSGVLALPLLARLSSSSSCRLNNIHTVGQCVRRLQIYAAVNRFAKTVSDLCIFASSKRKADGPQQVAKTYTSAWLVLHG